MVFCFHSQSCYEHQLCWAVIPSWKECDSPWNASPPSIDLHGESVMTSVACRDDAQYVTTQGGLAFPGTFIPTHRYPQQSPPSWKQMYCKAVQGVDKSRWDANRLQAMNYYGTHPWVIGWHSFLVRFGVKFSTMFKSGHRLCERNEAEVKAQPDNM